MSTQETGGGLGFDPFDLDMDHDRELLHLLLSEFPPQRVDTLISPERTAADLLPDDALLLGRHIAELRAQLLRDSAVASSYLAGATVRMRQPPTPAELEEARALNQAYLARSYRRTVAGVVTVSTASLALGGTLAVSAINSQAEADEAFHTEPPTIQLPTAPSAEPLLPSGPLPAYKDVVLHFVQVDGGSPMSDSQRQAAVTKVSAGMDIVGQAYKGRWNIGEVPVRADPTVHNLTVDGVSIRYSCAEAVDTQLLGRGILTALAARTTISPNTLDIVVIEGDEDKLCTAPMVGIPIAEKVTGDVIVYLNAEATPPTLAHETIHTTLYGHDNSYDAKLVDGTIRLDSKTPYVQYGNGGTLPGDGARAEKVADKDPLTGYHMAIAEVIAPSQVATVPEGKAMDVTLNALTADDTGEPVKVIDLPISAANRPAGANRIMLELSYEEDDLTLKAYGAGKSTYYGDTYDSTYLITLDPEWGVGINRKHLNEPKVIDLGGEKITITVKTIGTGDNGQATVSVQRS